jgi:GNAT superfamily N-acetyltransferase
MAATNHGAIAPLGPEDAAAGLALSDEAHWNQTEDDWGFFLSRGTVFGIRAAEDRVVATAALLPYTSTAAWISMVLVTARWRRRRLASQLLDRCLDVAKGNGLTAWLDATPAGASVYGPLGFVPTLSLQRLRFQSTNARATAPLQLTTKEGFNDFLAHDRRTIGFDRSVLLRELIDRPGSRLIASDGVLALIRRGRKASHIGPLFAQHQERAIAVLDAIVQSEGGPFLIDVVDDQRQIPQRLIDFGWIFERPFQRMRLGPVTTQDAEPPIAVAGPEYG